MKTSGSKITTVKKTAARKNVLDAQEQLDVQTRNKTLNQEEFRGKIAIKAYEIFERRGYTHGHDTEDWLEAERIVLEGLD